MQTLKKTAFLLPVLSTLAAIYLVLHATPQVAPNSIGQTQTVTVQGTVMRRGTSQPISDVQLTLITVVADAGADRSNRQSVQTAITDTAGRFTIAAVPVGTVRVQARHDDYFGPPVAGEYPPSFQADVAVSPDKPTELRISLVASASISGGVSDSVGKPLREASVEALRLLYENGTPTLKTVDTKSTDDRGAFRLYHLPPGQYYLAASPGTLPAVSRNASSNKSGVPARTFYPSAHCGMQRPQ